MLFAEIFYDDTVVPVMLELIQSSYDITQAKIINFFSQKPLTKIVAPSYSNY
jgi:hypothetical protein